jgi:hypothetical protein
MDLTKNVDQLFKNTLLFSLYIQAITGILNIITLFIKTRVGSYLLKELLMLELVVQFIEGTFYVWLFYNIKSVSNMTIHRYMDWFFTTPTMLVTLIAYLIYLDFTENKRSGSALVAPRLINILSDHSEIISWVIGLNALMLFFGAMGELQYIYPILAFSLGFIPFLIYFKMIYENFAIKTEYGQQIFFYFFLLWSLYGVASFFPYLWKNIGYNLLDIFSKNLFGFYLSYLLIFGS